MRLALPDFNCSNHLLFEVQEQVSNLQAQSNCVVVTEEGVTILNIRQSDDPSKLDLSVYSLIQLSLENTIDYFLDQDDQITALKIIQSNPTNDIV